MSNEEIAALSKELIDLKSQKKACLSIMSDIEARVFLINGSIDEIENQQAAIRLEATARQAAAGACQTGDCE